MNLLKTKKEFFKKLIKNYYFIFFLGFFLGFIAKLLDETPSNLLPPIIESLDLRNFLSRPSFWFFCGLTISVYSKTAKRSAIKNFLFFIGLIISYYAYTFFIAGFFPIKYAFFWLIFSLISPLFAYVCWQTRKDNNLSILISSLIMLIITKQAFSFGFWYLDISYYLEFLLWATSLFVLYKNPKQILLIIIFSTSLLFILTYFSFNFLFFF